MKILLLADQAEPTLWEHLDKRKLEGVELVLSTPDFVAAVGFTVQICDSLHLKM